MKSVAAAIVLASIWLAMLLLGGPRSALDPLIANALYVGSSHTFTAFARMLTGLGSWHVLVPVAIAGSAALFRRGGRRSAALLLAVVLAGRVAIELQKLAIARVRPELNQQLVHVISLSFPSAHAANSAITYLIVALLLGRRQAGLLFAAGLTLAIGISRVMLGVHWMSDVIGGWSFGLFWLVATQPLFGNAPGGPSLLPQRRRT